jgi:3-oxoacyl-[acyl-carrier protein] reductase
MDLGVAGRRYLVFGGSRGMGLDTARCLAADGANLALLARGREGLERVREELIGEFGVHVHTVVVDTSGDDATGRAVQRALDECGEVDGMAVLAGPMGSYGELHTQDDEAWDFYYHSQLMLTVRACRAVIPHLIERGKGTIVTTAAYSIRAQKPSLVHYTAMKSAIASVTKNIAKTYGSRGIRANCICPGFINTPLISVDRAEVMARYGLPEDEALYAYAKEQFGLTVALARVGRAAEVGELAAFLLSDRAAYVTGAAVNIDGGTDF